MSHVGLKYFGFLSAIYSEREMSTDIHIVIYLLPLTLLADPSLACRWIGELVSRYSRDEGFASRPDCALSWGLQQQ